MSQAFIVELEEQPIELCNLLKLLNLVESGGQAKTLIAEGYVGLNGELCQQKRKKVYAGDIVEFDGELYQIAQLSDESSTDASVTDTTSYDNIAALDNSEPSQYDSQAAAYSEQAPIKSEKAKSKPSQKKNKQSKSATKDKKTGRKPISFG